MDIALLIQSFLYAIAWILLVGLSIEIVMTVIDTLIDVIPVVILVLTVIFMTIAIYIFQSGGV